MHIPLDHHSGEPLYRQLVEAFRLRIVRGELTAGDQLPSLRELAEQLQINARTVVKAYDELERMDLVVLQQGRGAFVAAQRSTLPPRERRKRLHALAVKLLVEAAQVGSSIEEVVEVLHGVASELETQK